MHIVSGLFFLLLFYGICAYGMLCSGGCLKLREVYKSLALRQKAILLFVLAAFGAFVLYWVKQNHFVYYWDYRLYWSASIERMQYMGSHSFADTMRSLYQSINNDDYNILIPTVIALPLRVLGGSFSRYVSLNCMLFLVPAFLVQGMLATKLLRNARLDKGWIFVLAVFLAVCFPGNYYAPFLGYADVAFLLPMSVALYLLVDFDFGKMSPSRDLAIALLLVLSWLLRRYAVYFIMGYVAALLIKAACALVSGRAGIRRTAVHFILIGGTSLVILLACFRRFFLRALLTDYGNMFSAYDAPLAVKAAELASSFGYVTGLVILLGGMLCIWKRRNLGTYLSLAAMAATETMAFWQTQSMGTQHRLLLNLPVFTLCLLVLDFWDLHGLREARAGASVFLSQAVVAAGIFLLLANFAKAYVPVVSEKGTGSLFASRYHALQRGDIGALNGLAARLIQLTEGTDDRIYVAASGSVLNSDILRNLYMPDTNDAIPQMYLTADVDLRDGFPQNFLQAKYIVATDPVQLHLSTGQEVVRYLADSVQDGDSYIGRHFEYMEQVELDQGVMAKIYVKTSGFTEDDLQKLRNHYTELYPGNEALFADRIK